MHRGRVVVPMALLAAFVAACASDPGPTDDGIAPPNHHFVGDSVSFDYPATWREGHFVILSTASSSIVFLSTAELIDPCDRAQDAIGCGGEAVRSLEPDGIVVQWTANGFPGWTFDPTKGRRIAVGGRAATLEDLAPDESCRWVGGERQLLATIDNPTARWNWTSVRACLRGPDLDRLRAQVGAMLGSVAWH